MLSTFTRSWVWVFGTPAAAFDAPGIEVAPGDGDGPRLRVAEGVQVHFFGESCAVERT